MSKIQLTGFGLLVLALAVFTGCSKPQSSKHKVEPNTTTKDDDHDHGPGPHDGTIIELGKYHGEFTVNHKTQEATVYILGADAKKPAPIQVEKLQLSIKAPRFEVDLKPAPQEGDPAGKASRFVAKHENFGKEQEFEGTLIGVVDGKPHQVDFKEEEHKDHKHEKGSGSNK